MRKVELGRTGILVPVIGQGSFELERFDRDAVLRTLDRGIACGLTHIDTAYEYGLGRVEAEIVRPTIAGRRHEVVVTSKLLPAVSHYDGVIAACEATLARLDTDYLDLFLLHWWEGRPLEDTFEAFERLVREGKIRAYGVSNLDCEDLEHAIAVAGPGRIACNQVCYNLQQRQVERRLLALCRAHGVTLTAYSPFGDHSTPSTLFPRTLERAGPTLESIAETHGVSARNVALAFLTRSPGVLAIPKAERAEYAEDNARAGDLSLLEDEIARIDRALPISEDPRVPWCREA